MKIGIMGGTFNPIHNAHLMIAAIAKEEFNIDRLLFMPGGNPPHKKDNTDVLNADIRCEMVKLAIVDNPEFEYCGYEAEKDSYSYTAETLEHFKKLYPSAQLMFIIGGDSLFSIESWHRPADILKLAELCVFERPGGKKDIKSEISRLNKKYNANIQLLNAPMTDISSSMIRMRIRQNKSVRYMLPEPVRKFIIEKRIYDL